MATPKAPPASIFMAAIFSQSDEVIVSVSQECQRLWGNIALTSPSFDHSETSYYEREMGAGLRKQFVVFDGVFDPAELADRKLASNAIEDRAAAQNRAGCSPPPSSLQMVVANLNVARPVNIDPGYITLTKLVLASAKDRAHRIYLNHGIYAEECLYYLGGEWHSRPWTYPDYQRADFQDFFSQAREMLKSQLRGG